MKKVFPIRNRYRKKNLAEIITDVLYISADSISERAYLEGGMSRIPIKDNIIYIYIYIYIYTEREREREFL